MLVRIWLVNDKPKHMTRNLSPQSIQGIDRGSTGYIPLNIN